MDERGGTAYSVSIGYFVEQARHAAEEALGGSASEGGLLAMRDDVTPEKLVSVADRLDVKRAEMVHEVQELSALTEQLRRLAVRRQG